MGWGLEDVVGAEPLMSATKRVRRLRLPRHPTIARRVTRAWPAGSWPRTGDRTPGPSDASEPSMPSMPGFSVGWRGRLAGGDAAAASLLRRLGAARLAGRLRPGPLARRLGPARLARRLGPARLAILFAFAVALGGAWLWFRDSSVVSIKRVTVTGLTGPGAGHIRAALVAAARGMSTLDVQMSRLHTAVQPFPDVRALQVSTEFPHGLRIHVVEQLPAAVLTAAGHRLAVSADGTVLREVRPARTVPVIAVRALPVGPRVTDPVQDQELNVIAAAPRSLRPRIAAVSQKAAHGIVVRLRAGPSLYFGAAGQLRAKWVSATAVLANHGSDGAAYIDVTDPQRPAAG